MLAAELQTQLRKEIPVAKAMQVSVESVTDSVVKLSAPLAPNTNHKATAFGGSIHSLAVLSCLSLLTHRLRHLKIDYVVIQSSQMEYLKPISSDFAAEGRFDGENAWDTFLAILTKKKLGRISMQAQVKVGEDVCATLKAQFVAGLP